MSWHYLQEPVGGCSVADCSAGERSVPSRSATTAGECYCSDSATVALIASRSGTTRAHSTGDPGVDAWILSLRAGHASQHRRTENSLASTTSGGPGLMLSEYFAKLEPGRSWVKTSPGCSQLMLDGSLELYSQTWPRSGSCADGTAFLRVPLAPLTPETEFGLLPTPRKRDGKSFYVTTRETAARRFNKRSGLGRAHWVHVAILCTALNKAWANPHFSELMMGWPIGWTGLRPVERDGFQRWLAQHGSC